MKRASGRREDFVLPLGNTLELKSDFYRFDATPNMFMERWYDVHKQKVGGPWATLDKGIDLFVYWYVQDGMAYWFHTDALVERLGEGIANGEFDKCQVVNKGWISEGYKVPRRAIIDVGMEVQYDPQLYLEQLKGYSFSTRMPNKGGRRS
jgi:hypothetical protein